MLLTLTIALLLLAVMLHEMGHALAMRSCGIGIEEVGVGFPVPMVPRFIVTLFRRSGKPLRVSISPILLGAYVKPAEQSEEKIEALSYRDQAFIAGAGVLANLLLASMIFAIAGFIFGVYWKSAVAILTFGLLWFFRRAFCSYAVPLASCTLPLLIGYYTFKHHVSVDGPIGAIRLAKEMAGSLKEALLFGFALSLSLALLNVFPLYPLDGARTILALLRNQRARSVFQSVGFVLLVVLIGWGLYTDVANLM